VPDKATLFCGAPPPGMTTSVADFAPLLVGLNTTLAVQLAPDASDDPQFVVRANWPGFAPPRTMPFSGNATLPVLWTVTIFAGLVVPTARDPKPRLEGLTV
jgi:hypothetical protein